MSRARYIGNTRVGPKGTLIQGNIVQEPIAGMDLGIPDKTSTTQMYPLGTRLITADGRVFRYCLSAAAIQAGRGTKTALTMASDGIAASSNGTQAVGDTHIDFASQTFAEDELKGGYLVIYSAGSTYQQRYITGNTAASASTVRVYFDAPLTTATSSTYCEALGNPYRYMSSASTGYGSCLGVSHVVIAAAGTYFWIQTWGPLWCNPGPYGMGGDAQERHVIFNPDGSLRPRNEHAGDGVDYQLAGFILEVTGVGADGCPFIMLQISP